MKFKELDEILKEYGFELYYYNNDEEDNILFSDGVEYYNSDKKCTLSIEFKSDLDDDYSEENKDDVLSLYKKDDDGSGESGYDTLYHYRFEYIHNFIKYIIKDINYSVILINKYTELINTLQTYKYYDWLSDLEFGFKFSKDEYVVVINHSISSFEFYLHLNPVTLEFKLDSIPFNEKTFKHDFISLLKQSGSPNFTYVWDSRYDINSWSNTMLLKELVCNIKNGYALSKHIYGEAISYWFDRNNIAPGFEYLLEEYDSFNLSKEDEIKYGVYKLDKYGVPILHE